MKIEQILFTFPLPPDLNEQIKANRGGVVIGSKQKRLWTKKIAAEARAQCPDCPQWDQVWVAAEFYIRTHARDSDGIEATKKFIYDGLQAAGVLKNDNLKVIRSPVIQYFVVDRSLADADQFVNLLVMSSRPPVPSFSDLVITPEAAEDLEAAACA